MSEALFGNSAQSLSYHTRTGPVKVMDVWALRALFKTSPKNLYLSDVPLSVCEVLYHRYDTFTTIRLRDGLDAMGYLAGGGG